LCVCPLTLIHTLIEVPSKSLEVRWDPAASVDATKGVDVRSEVDSFMSLSQAPRYRFSRWSVPATRLQRLTAELGDPKQQ